MKEKLQTIINIFQYLLWQLICWNQVKKIDDLVINLKEMPHLVKFSFMNFPQTDKIILSRNMQLIPELTKKDPFIRLLFSSSAL